MKTINELKELAVKADYIRNDITKHEDYILGEAMQWVKCYTLYVKKKPGNILYYSTHMAVAQYLEEQFEIELEDEELEGFFGKEILELYGKLELIVLKAKVVA